MTLNRVIAHFLSKHTNLTGCVWIPSSADWSRSFDGKRRFIEERIRRRGYLKAIDEAAYRVLYRMTEGRRNSYHNRLAKRIIKQYWSENEILSWGPYVHTGNINSKMVLRAVDQFKPDVIFAHCIHQYFSKELRAKAPLGTYLWHIGVLPEYRGLYSPFWALHNLDFSNVGYSLFKMNDKLDGGEVFVQGRVENLDVLRDNHHTIEHKVIVQSFPEVARFIGELEAGTARPLELTGSSGYYTYPGLTDYIRQRYRLATAARKNPTVPPNQRSVVRSEV